ncbi:helix-turn-helix transcriptional regulator [Brucella grignonensis]|uniref:helix-turn-helix transcriptional regulator n=1 Tax=Brucella grignonensis TaxID=94627 RepID=UPI000B98C826|nr:AlpA family phage regulatory protein [Brucella grignonensis]NKB83749.1 AlpA family phage regulatory protein [Brucella grignonensis]
MKIENTNPTLISLNDCCSLTSLSRTAINKMRADGRFPEPVNLGEKRIAFVRSEVVAWLEARIASRPRRAAA